MQQVKALFLMFYFHFLEKDQFGRKDYEITTIVDEKMLEKSGR